jgi:hypothetical protein
MRGLSPADERSRKRMTGVVSLLVANLREELERVKTLYLCLVRERKILCGTSAEDLHRSNRDKEQVLQDLEATRSSRAPLLAELSEVSGVPAERLSLSTVASLVAGPVRQELMTLRKGLVLLAEKIRSLNDLNRDLIESSRRYAAGWLQFLLSAASAAPCYGKEGVVPQTGLSGRFFRVEG